jgi:toxin YoeB
MPKIHQIVWLDDAKADFAFWIKTDKLIVKRIESLIDSIESTPESGIGKPEGLKHKFSGYWSRRINLEHRLIYKVLHDKKQVLIVSCKGHYSNNQNLS